MSTVDMTETIAATLRAQSQLEEQIARVVALSEEKLRDLQACGFSHVEIERSMKPLTRELKTARRDLEHTNGLLGLQRRRRRCVVAQV